MNRILAVALSVAALVVALAPSFPAFNNTASAQFRTERSSEHRDRSRRTETERLNANLGWQQVNFESNAHASELYLDVLRGRVQLDRAEIVFRNGQRTTLDLNNRLRDRGRIQLARFDNVRNIDRVIVTARARSSDATIALWRDDMGQQVGLNDRYDNDEWRWRR